MLRRPYCTFPKRPMQRLSDNSSRQYKLASEQQARGYCETSTCLAASRGWVVLSSNRIKHGKNNVARHHKAEIEV